RDIFRRSNIGVLATRRTPTASGSDSGVTFGFDANFYLYKSISLTSYYARTDDRASSGNQASYRGRFDYTADRYGATAEYLVVGDGFNPEVGFTRRRDFRSSSATLRFSPRLKDNARIRKLNWEGSFRDIADAHGRIDQNREEQFTFRTD